MEDKGKISLELFAKIEHAGYEPLPHGLRNVISWAVSRNAEKRGTTPPNRLQGLYTKEKCRGGCLANTPPNSTPTLHQKPSP